MCGSLFQLLAHSVHHGDTLGHLHGLRKRTHGHTHTNTVSAVAVSLTKAMDTLPSTVTVIVSSFRSGLDEWNNLAALRGAESTERRSV